MKLSRTAWNNVIIFSVMIIILLINGTNDTLFPDSKDSSQAEQLLLPEHSVILTLVIGDSAREHIKVERVGRGWQISAQSTLATLSEQQIEQMMFAWQHSEALLQADDIVIDEAIATQVTIALAGAKAQQHFSVYPLNEQLLVFNQLSKQWFALPAALARQLLPVIPVK
ncbi:MAG: hypothetical protein GY919_05980 [Photobacterium aquimaris]|nr:hypothetical protein [Photobacterium aquimaris]